ncbi:hypothetical protein FPV67DRAFT_1446712 [Lyophyllum atratum]|nr:hypothetical protein FPV67DRAFT_1446712 [Lyophyllum atratum]
MEVVNSRAALLSNHEVLMLLRELESDHLSRAKTAMRVKKEDEAAGHPIRPAGGDVLSGEPSENLRTVEIEVLALLLPGTPVHDPLVPSLGLKAMQYLSADFLPTTRQSPHGIAQLVKDLASYELTKAEKLQIVNLAPTLPVELYVIVEELEDRLGDQMENILAHVQSGLSSSALSTGSVDTYPVILNSDEYSALDGPLTYPEDNEGYHEDIVFDDVGEGAGIEGDLDMDED